MPVSLTSLPVTATWTRWASNCALRTNAAVILALACAGETAVEGFNVIVFRTPLTPGNAATARQAASRWYCQSTLPDKVIT